VGFEVGHFVLVHDDELFEESLGFGYMVVPTRFPLRLLHFLIIVDPKSELVEVENNVAILVAKVCSVKQGCGFSST